MEGEDIAIFWDYENVRLDAQKSNVPVAESLISYSKTIGHTTIKRVYCNWKNISQPLIQALYSMGFDPIQVSMGKANSVDIKLTVDCMNTSFNYPSIKHFIIVTGDKDYVPLVNWLKDNKKNVIIIGNTSTVSDHLILSGDDFLSLEDLNKIHQDSSEKEPEVDFIPFEDAVNCLKEAIETAREQGKSTRFEIIDHLMRINDRYNYSGSSSVLKNHNESFSSFTKFLSFAEEQKLIQINMFEDFKEIFLLEEDPNIESEFSPTLKARIEKKDWKLILKEIIKTFNKKSPDLLAGHRFAFLSMIIHNLKKRRKFPYSNRKLRDALNTLVDVGFLLEQEDERFLLNEDYASNLDEWLDSFIPE